MACAMVPAAGPSVSGNTGGGGGAKGGGNKMMIHAVLDGGYQFYDKERSDACLRGFHALYEQQSLCDVTLVAQGQDFQCHRAMLAASSPYFQVCVVLF